MKIAENLYMDSLYDFVDREGRSVNRYLITFYGEENKRYDIEIDLIDECYIEIVPGESDEIDGEDRNLLFYLLDKWAINHII